MSINLYYTLYYKSKLDLSMHGGLLCEYMPYPSPLPPNALALGDLAHMFLLTVPPKCLDCRLVPPHLVYVVSGLEPRTL